MKAAKDKLRDVTLTHESRIDQAIAASHAGEDLTVEMAKILRQLRIHIEDLEEIRVQITLEEGFVPSRQQQRAHTEAMVEWSTCLPETEMQLRARRPIKDILNALLEPSDEKRVPTVTDLSGLSERRIL